MKKILAGAVGGVAAFAVIFGAGPAGADNEYKGQTYEKVQESTNGGAVIASRVGSFLPTEQCIVTGNRRATFGGGTAAKLLVDLNCNDPMTLGHPGHSAAGELGQRAQRLKGQAAVVSDNYAKRDQLAEQGKTTFCEQDADRCRFICEQSRACSAELTDYLGL